MRSLGRESIGVSLSLTQNTGDALLITSRAGDPNTKGLRDRCALFRSLPSWMLVFDRGYSVRYRPSDSHFRIVVPTDDRRGSTFLGLNKVIVNGATVNRAIRKSTVCD